MKRGLVTVPSLGISLEAGCLAGISCSTIHRRISSPGQMRAMKATGCGKVPGLKVLSNCSTEPVSPWDGMRPTNSLRTINMEPVSPSDRACVQG